MYLEQQPDNRKSVVPWYDSEASCYFVIFLMVLVLLFALIGISVAYQSTHLVGTLMEYLWVPILLGALSSVVMFSTSVRLIKRYMGRFQNRYLKNFSADDFD